MTPNIHRYQLLIDSLTSLNERIRNLRAMKDVNLQLRFKTIRRLHRDIKWHHGELKTLRELAWGEF